MLCLGLERFTFVSLLHILIWGPIEVLAHSVKVLRIVMKTSGRRSEGNDMQQLSHETTTHSNGIEYITHLRVQTAVG
jgi:hypothetical protein